VNIPLEEESRCNEKNDAFFLVQGCVFFSLRFLGFFLGEFFLLLLLGIYVGFFGGFFFFSLNRIV